MDEKLLRNDYDVNAFDKDIDPRFEDAKKDCIFAQALWFIEAFVTFVLAYALSPQDPANNTYICGFPAWVFVGLMVCLISIIAAMVYNFVIMKDCSLEAKN